MAALMRYRFLDVGGMKLLLTSNLTLAGSEFHTVCVANENAQHTILVVVNVVATIFQQQFQLPVLSSDMSKGRQRKCKHRRNFVSNTPQMLPFLAIPISRREYDSAQSTQFQVNVSSITNTLSCVFMKIVDPPDSFSRPAPVTCVYNIILTFRLQL